MYRFISIPVSNSPEREEAFQATTARALYTTGNSNNRNNSNSFFTTTTTSTISTSCVDVDSNSFYAFHGSPLHNWYSILRNHLKVMTGSNYMSAGGTYGAGVYLASQSNGLSASYCSSNGLDASATRIIAIVEVKGREEDFVAKPLPARSKPQPQSQPQPPPQPPLQPNLIPFQPQPNPANGPANRRKTFSSNIRVVPDSENIIIRYLMVVAPTTKFPLNSAEPGGDLSLFLCRSSKKLVP